MPKESSRLKNVSKTTCVNNHKALLIGINYIHTNSELRGCINDIDNIEKYIKGNYNIQQSSIRRLSEKSGDFALPIRKNILEGIQWLIDGAKSGDTLFMHYSGHGSYIPDKDGDETDGRDECLVPLDYSMTGMITDDELRVMLVSCIPLGVKLFCIFDCCHSGTILDLYANWEIKHNTYSMRREKKYYTSKGDVYLISGCLDAQTSADAYTSNATSGKTQFEGALTNGFLKVVKKYGDNLSLYNLMYHLLNDLEREGYEQKPSLSTAKVINIFSEKLKLL